MTAGHSARALGLLIATVLVTGAGAQPVETARPQAPPYRTLVPAGGGPFPAVLFASGCSGFTPAEAPRHYERVAAEFTAEGFVVVLVDYLGARGLERCGGIHPDEIAADILTAVAYAGAHPLVDASRISVIGWSMGGSGVLAAVAALPGDRPPPFRAAVAYYPRCYGIQTPWQARVPLLMLLAELDDLSSAWACQELVKRLAGAAPLIEVRVYPNARHAFDVPELPALLRRSRGGTLGHDPQAAGAAREEVRRFLGLRPSGP
jgi:dienelactone hydrolase